MGDLENKLKDTNPALASFFSEAKSNEEDNTDYNDAIAELEMAGIYEIGDIIASGGIKTIRKAIDCKTRREIAMAQLKPEHLSVVNIERFIREARTLASLEHSNIVPIYEINHEQESGLFFTMKLLSGETLGSIVKKLQAGESAYKKKYPQRRLLEIFTQVCDAIIYAHSKEIVHLDLKPDNIQISEFGEVSVMDWGMAKQLNREDDSGYESRSKPKVPHGPVLSNLTKLGSISGTPGYMSPEQIDKEKSEAGKSSDIYSLGATLYALLYHIDPYSSLSTKEIIEQTEKGVSPGFPERTDANNIPTALISVMKKAMSHSPNERYENVLRLKKDIDLYLNDFTTHAENMKISRLLFLFLKRHYTATITTCIVALLISAISYYAVSAIEEKEEQLNATADEVILGTINKEDEYRQSGEFSTAIDTYNDLLKMGYHYPKFQYNLACLYAGALDLGKSLYHLNNIKQSNSEIRNSPEFEIVYTNVKQFHEDGLSLKNDSKAAIFAEKMPERIQYHVFYTINKNPNKPIEHKIRDLKRNLKAVHSHLKEDFQIKVNREGKLLNVDLSNNKKLTSKAPIMGLPMLNLNISNTNINISDWGGYKYVEDSLRSIDMSYSPNVLNQNYFHRLKITKLISKYTNYTCTNVRDIPTLKYLDVEGSRFGTQRWVFSETLEFLNIAHTDFYQYDILHRFKNLKTLVIDKSMTIPKDYQKRIKENGTKVVIKD